MPIFSTENLASAMLYSLAKILAVKMFNPLSPVPAVTSRAKTHPQFPVPAVTGCKKACEDNCLSYPP